MNSENHTSESHSVTRMRVWGCQHGTMLNMSPAQPKPAAEQRRNQPLTGIRLDPHTDKLLRVKLAQEHMSKQAMLETLIRAWLLPAETLIELGLDKLVDLGALRAEMQDRGLLPGK